MLRKPSNAPGDGGILVPGYRMSQKNRFIPALEEGLRRSFDLLENCWMISPPASVMVNIISLVAAWAR